jgi:hypothetical protein
MLTRKITIDAVILHFRIFIKPAQMSWLFLVNLINGKFSILQHEVHARKQKLKSKRRLISFVDGLSIRKASVMTQIFENRK